VTILQWIAISMQYLDGGLRAMAAKNKKKL